MAENIEAVGLEFDTREFERSLERTLRRLDELEEQFDGTVRAADRQGRVFDGLGRKVIALASAYGAFRAAERSTRFLVDTNREFEQLEARLTTITGSVDRAESAFDLITGFASSTPFEIQNLTRAFINLQAVGIEPTLGMMEDLGNFAAAMGGDINEFVTAVIKAAQGGTERLREAFFVPVRVEGDELVVDFRGKTQRIRRDFETVVEGFRAISRENFGDAMARQMDTMEGAISNLQDSSSLLAKEIGDAGLTREITNLVKTIERAIQDGDEFSEVIGRNMAAGVRLSAEALEAFVRHIDTIVFGMEVLAGVGIAHGIVRLARVLRTATGAMLGLNAAIAANPVGFIATLAGAIGGPLLFHLLTARDAAAELADEIERVGDADLSALTGEQLRGYKEGLERQNRELTQQLQAGAGEGFLARRAANEARIAAIDAEMQRRQMLPGIDVGGGGGVDERVAKAIENITRRLEEEQIRLDQGEEAALRYALAKEGIVGTAQEEIVALDRTVRGLKEAEAAAEEAEKADERRRESISQILEGLAQEEAALAGTREDLLLYNLAKLQATEADREAALAKLRHIEALELEQDAQARIERERIAMLKAEAQQLKSAADRMAEGVLEAFDEIITGADSVGDAIVDMVDRWLEQMARLTIQMSIVDPLSALLRGFLTPIPGAPPPVPGPEVIGNLDIPGAVLTPRPTASQGSSAVVNQNINFNITAMDARDVQRMLHEQKGEIRRIVGEAVLESGSFQRSLFS